MKKFLILTLALSLFGGFYSRAQDVTVIEGVDKVVVSSKKGEHVVMENQGNVDWKMQYPFLGGSDSFYSFKSIKDIYWGWDFNYGEKGNIKNCFEVGVANVVGVAIKPWKCGPSFNIGLGFGMRRYLAKDGMRFDRLDNNLMILTANGLDIDKSRVDSWTFHLPIMITQNIYKKLAVSAGAWLNFNTYVKGETQYWHSGQDVRYKEYYKGFNHRFFTVDLVAVVGLRNGIGFYGRWSPMSLFNDGRGPEFKTATMGVMLNF